MHIEAIFKMLNGWNHGKFQDHLTCASFHGCSAVDLVLTSNRHFTKEKVIQYLSVQDLSSLSEHKPVLLSLSINNGGELKVYDKISCSSSTLHKGSERLT